MGNRLLETHLPPSGRRFCLEFAPANFPPSVLFASTNRDRSLNCCSHELQKQKSLSWRENNFAKSGRYEVQTVGSSVLRNFSVVAAGLGAVVRFSLLPLMPSSFPAGFEHPAAYRR